MAGGRKPGEKFGGRDWVKGQSGNPKGKPKTPEDVKEARKFTQFEFERAFSKLFFLSVAELEDIVMDKYSTNVMEGLIGRILLKGINEASRAELNYFIERFLGKIPENHNFSGNLNTGLVDFIERIKQAKEVQRLAIENKTGEEAEEED